MRRMCINKLEEAFKGEFMQPEITEKKYWWEVTTSAGIFYVPENVNVEYAVEGRVESCVRVLGYGGRLSAAGFLDSTDWIVCDNVTDVVDTILQTYGDI
jgi:hypothetical protein